MAILGVDGVVDDADRYLLNDMNAYSHETQLGDKLFSMKSSFVGKYDFAVQGGATGLYYFKDAKGQDLALPDNFVVTNVIIDKVTSIQSAATTADVSIGLNSTADLLASSPESTVDGTGFEAGIPVGTAATAVKTTAERKPSLTISTAALTAGKWYVQFEGYLSESF